MSEERFKAAAERAIEIANGDSQYYAGALAQVERLFATEVSAALERAALRAEDEIHDGDMFGAFLRSLIPSDSALPALLAAEREDAEAARDSAYAERNQLVAALAKVFPAGTASTAIEGWDPEWHNCVYIDLPTGQVSWHYHDRESHLFAHLPRYTKPWDGHSTEEKYQRLAALPSGLLAAEREEERRLRDSEWNTAFSDLGDPYKIEAFPSGPGGVASWVRHRDAAERRRGAEAAFRAMGSVEISPGHWILTDKDVAFELDPLLAPAAEGGES